MFIPVVIVNWNGIEDTRECIDSLLQIDYDDFKIYVLDNGSSGNDAEQLQSQYEGHPQIRIFSHEKNLGFAKGNNWVVNQLLDEGDDFIALLNNDTVVDKYWLTELYTVAREYQADVVSSKLVQYHNRQKLDNVGHQMLNTGEIIPIGHGEPADRYGQVMPNLGSCAAGTLYSTRLIRHLGLFDDHFSTGYEDAELGVRAFVAGYQCVYAPGAIVYHKVGRSIGKVFDARYPAMIQSYIWYTYFKLMPWPVLLLNAPFIVFKSLIILLLNLLFLRFKYIRIMFYGWKKTWLDRKAIYRSRKAFFSAIERRSSWDIMTLQTFFLVYDLRRFWRVYLNREATAFDSYGGK